MGAAPFVRKKQIPVDDSTTVAIVPSDMSSNGRRLDQIEVSTQGETVTFGATMKKDRTKFLCAWIERNLPDDSPHF